MLAVDLVHAVDRYHEAVNAFVNGDPEPEKELYSHRDDVTLANPLGPPAHGWRQVEQALERAASQVRGAEPMRFERIADYGTADLAFILELERVRMKIGGSAETMPVSLRTTTIFRREDDGWKVLHRHADPITSPRPVESVVERVARDGG